MRKNLVELYELKLGSNFDIDTHEINVSLKSDELTDDDNQFWDFMEEGFSGLLAALTESEIERAKKGECEKEEERKRGRGRKRK